MRNKLAILFIFLLGASLYALTIRGAQGNPNPETIRVELAKDFKSMELSPERGRFAHVMALSEYGTYDLPQVLADFVYPDVGYYQGKFYSYFAPGISYMAVPFYNLGKQFDLSQVFTFALVSIFSIGAMVFMYLIARQILELPIWASITAPLIFAFGSSAWSYATTLYQHHFTVFFFMAGFYAAWRYGKNTKWSWVWGFIPWICYASAFTVDYPNMLFLLPMMIYFFWRAWTINQENDSWQISFRPSLIFLSIGFIAITAWHLNLNANNFGGWQKLAGTLTKYEANRGPATSTITTATSTTVIIPSIINNLLPANPASSSFVTNITTSPETAPKKEKNVLRFFSETRLFYSGYILLVSTERGLLIFWPLIIPAFFGLYSVFKSRKAEVATLLGGVLANMFLYFSWGDPWGGWAFGPRYMILSISILSLFVSYWMAKGGIWERIVVFGLFAYSYLISLIGVLTTNANPPKIEAIPLGADYTYFRNIDFFINGKSGSFFFNTYANQYLTLQEYAALIYLSLLLLVALLIFVFPRFKHDN